MNKDPYDIPKSVLKQEIAKYHKVISDYTNMLRCRAGKLLRQGTPFIVVSIKEDYYPAVYRLIKLTEKAKGTWTEKCEDDYKTALNAWSGRCDENP